MQNCGNWWCSVQYAVTLSVHKITYFMMGNRLRREASIATPSCGEGQIRGLEACLAALSDRVYDETTSAIPMMQHLDCSSPKRVFTAKKLCMHGNRNIARPDLTWCVQMPSIMVTSQWQHRHKCPSHGPLCSRRQGS